MSSAALLAEDFGSESEDDNFNPAPAEDSDNDAAGESDEEVNSRANAHTFEQRRRLSEQEVDVGKDDADGSLVNGRQTNGHGSRAPANEKDEGPKKSDARRLNGADEGGDPEDEEDEDDDEEEEDEEEAISVYPCV